MKSFRVRVAALMVVAVALFSGLPLLADEDGAALFKKSCAPCHGANGAGDTAMGKKLGAKALGSADVQKLSDDALKQVISKGKGKMPSFGKLSADQLKSIVAFIRSLKK